MNGYSFGFLDRSETLRFGDGDIVPIEEFEAAREWVSKYKHKDGFLYPPETFQLVEGRDEAPNSRRPAHLYRVPASHLLRCTFDASSEDAHRTNASLVMQLVAYLHETWLQFDDWWFDARVPMTQHRLCASKTTAESFLSHSYEAWRQWPDQVRRRVVTTLFMFNRAPSYQWDWEHFVAQYMVFDALYKTAVELHAVSEAKNHASRIQRMCHDLGLVQDAAKIEEFVRLRNDLLHEALWDGGQPGSAGSGGAFMCQYDLRRLNQRLIPAILKYENTFVSSNWWTCGRVGFTEP